MQEYTQDVDPSLTLDTLDQVGGKLMALPQGWRFETKVLARDLSLDTARCDGWAAIIRDELHGTYQGCGYGADTSANYVP
jgi:nitrogen fixation protein